MRNLVGGLLGSEYGAALVEYDCDTSLTLETLSCSGGSSLFPALSGSSVVVVFVVKSKRDEQLVASTFDPGQTTRSSSL